MEKNCLSANDPNLSHKPEAPSFPKAVAFSAGASCLQLQRRRTLMPLTPDNLYLEWWPIREINQSQRNTIGKLHAVKIRRSHFSMELVYGFTPLAILLPSFL